MPFLPGGLDDIVLPEKAGESSTNNKQLRKVAPGLSRGLRLPGDEDDEILDLDVDKVDDGGEEPPEEVRIICLIIL